MIRFKSTSYQAHTHEVHITHDPQWAMSAVESSYLPNVTFLESKNTWTRGAGGAHIGAQSARGKVPAPQSKGPGRSSALGFWALPTGALRLPGLAPRGDRLEPRVGSSGHRSSPGETPVRTPDLNGVRLLLASLTFSRKMSTFGWSGPSAFSLMRSARSTMCSTSSCLQRFQKIHERADEPVDGSWTSAL